MPYRRIASEIDLTAKNTTFVDLGGMPQPTNNPALVDTLIEKSKTVEPEDWYLTLHISKNAISDDQTGRLESQFKNIMPAFQRHINTRVFTYLNVGDGTTLGLSVDGLALFSDAHIWPGGKNTTGQDNKLSTNLTLDNFNAAWVAARGFKDDAGNYLNYNYDLLVTSPTNNTIAANITGNREAYDTANREINPYAGMSYITAPELDTTAWYLVATSELSKPLFVAIKQRPMLNDMWFDAQQHDGGIWYFQYHGRYTVDYADWPTIVQGSS
jgi:phage major head subunit gpT-like protein